ncbi:MAG TPA: NAD(P)H-hydrate dehydratase [Ilumatobacteraceae bacterium]|nr:NAD(P)H-hydrate dehydratase [Ilumatobacteraceae bacterium]HRB01974.1 NAD(P)H-hydrate dehydratase [Ilumatobacteraceae bacterium]
MIPIVTPDEMRAVDAAASEPTAVLVERAGRAVARAAVSMMGGTYGRTVHVITGPGNNGADGRVAAAVLASRGVSVHVHDAFALPQVLSPADLVIDAAYGTGFRETWNPPDVGSTPVLAVDVPSGVNALTGEALGDVLAATRTLTFAALKPGLLMPPGSELVGELELADIGLGEAAAHHAHAHLVQPADVAAWLPVRSVTAHKWRAAVRVVAGSVGMTGAAQLASHAAMRAGAGMVHLSAPGTMVVQAPVEVVQRPLPVKGWAGEVLDSLDRFQALVVGPGLGRSDETTAQARLLAVQAPIPTVIDGDGLFAMAWNAEGAAALLRRRTAPTVLTPHDGEYALLVGAAPGADRMVAARRLAVDTGCVVLLKGATTVVADPDGQVLLVTTGDSRLATAGTGDVLSGIIGALLAGGVPAFQAAAAGAWMHGQAANSAPATGMIASDIAEHLPAVARDLAALGGE